MAIPSYPKALNIFLKNKRQPVATEEEVVREARLHDSIENNNDPNDMPLEVEKNLKANLGPIDTVFEVNVRGQDNEETNDESPRP